MEGQEGQSDRADFLRFIQESGIDSILIESIGELHDLPEKPEDATEWLRKIFRRDAPNRGEELETQMAILKDEVIKKEWRIRALRMEEKKKLSALKLLRLKAQTISNLKDNEGNEYEDYYKDWSENVLWRVQPDPFFRTSCSAKKLFGMADDTKITKPPEQKDLNEREGSNDSESDDDVKKFIMEKQQVKLAKDNEEMDSSVGDDSQRKDKKKQRKEKDKSPYPNVNTSTGNKKTKRRLGSNLESVLVQKSSPPPSEPGSLIKPKEPSVNDRKSINNGTENEIASTGAEDKKPKKRKEKEKNKSKFDMGGKTSSNAKGKGAKKKTKQGDDNEEILAETPTDDDEDGLRSPLNRDGRLSAPYTKIHSDLPKGFLEHYMQNIPRGYWTNSFSTSYPSLESEESSSSEDELLELTKEFSSHGFKRTNKAPAGKWHQNRWNSQVISENIWQHQYEKEKDNYKDIYPIDNSTMMAAVTDPVKIEKEIEKEVPPVTESSVKTSTEPKKPKKPSIVQQHGHVSIRLEEKPSAQTQRKNPLLRHFMSKVENR